MKISELTAGEEQLMNVLWKLEYGYMREIIEFYPDPKPHPNTISTFLKILVEKEFLQTTREGRIFKYTVAIPFEDYKKYKLGIFLEYYFDNSPKNLVKTLLAENLIHPADFKEFFEVKTTIHSNLKKEKRDSDLSDFIEEITAPKKKKVGKEKKKKNKLSKQKKKKKL
ncbi:BlaI/MecI/CopY family transcriptional regulator [Kaistella polysaccharea]|uniref:BlaI/MecI/CopY family transcriptional regulator n=1 Tax=Kaistella polysaccharea TaxID=2878534 RepID=UPI001CF1F032|nr:BlaI/MecI/CopY family transcriptional regulator [Kaistella polysaccharea]